MEQNKFGKMKIKDNLRNVISMFKRMTRQEIEIYKYVIIGLLVFDLIGIYWYWNLKSLGTACMIVIIAFLAVFLFLERNLKGGNNMANQTPEEVQKEIEELENKKKLKDLNDKKEKLKKELGEEEYKDLTPKEDSNSGMDFGLPDADTFHKRASKALGADQF